MNTNDSGIPFNIELGCPLFIQANSLNQRIPTFLIGVIPQAGLIIKTPYLQNVENAILPGEEIVLRYVFMGEVFGFKSKIMTSIGFPFRLTFIAYPAKIEKMSLRKKKRILCNIPASIAMNGYDELKGVMIDMSSNGFLFSARMFDEDTPPPLSLNCPVEIFMPLMGIEGRTKLEGIIRNIRRNDNGLQLGIALTNLSDDISVMLEKYVYTIMRHA